MMSLTTSTYHNILYLLLLFIILSFNLRCNAKTSCSNSTYDSGSRFDTNPGQLFAKLNTTPQLFYEVSIGDHQPDEVFGMALCRGDTTIGQLAGCQGCLRSAIGGITRECPNHRTAVIWYDSCMLRYSDRNFFAVANTTLGICAPYSKSATETNTGDLNASVTTLLSNLSSLAANSSNLFAAGKVNSNITLYGLAECTKDLSADDCYTCLVNNENKLVTLNCNGGKRAAKIVAENCYLWYNDSSSFYKSEVDLVEIGITNGGTAASNTSTAGDGIGATNYTPANVGGKIRRKTIIVATFGGVAGLTVIVTMLFFLLKTVKKITWDSKLLDAKDTTEVIQFQDMEMPRAGVYTIKELKDATENFSSSKILGAGGFGVVYEAMIDGVSAAVKSFDTSKVNVEKLKKELSLVANIEHPNILKLMGYCFGKDRYFFVYEYMPNGSLDIYLKDSAGRQNLNWLTRLEIIKGIANGLYALHNCLEKKMIHADLKLENILLSKEMTATIADFDLLRAFETDQTHQSTDNGAGTLGYMAPEVIWAPRTRYSVKSDVYSFGIMVLEIVTGQRIGTFGKTDSHPNLISFVWNHWNCKTQREVIDPYLDFENNLEQIVRCVHLGLLCIQHKAEIRPDMFEVVDVLMNTRKPLPEPSIPGFHRDPTDRLHEPGITATVLETA